MKLVITENDFRARWKVDRAYDLHLLETLRSAIEAKANQYITEGLPADYHKALRYFGEELAERADILLYPTKKTQAEAQQIFDGLVVAIAVLVFVKGGVEIFDARYEVIKDV